MTSSTFAALRREIQERSGGKLTPDPRCQCGALVPPNRWNLHVASCPAVRSHDDPPESAA